MEKRAALALRNLPSVDEVLRTPTARSAVDRFGHLAVAGAVRHTLAAVRAQNSVRGGSEEIAASALAQLEADARPNLRAVFNLTGTVLHTNFGRALLAEAAIEAAVAAMRHAVALEYDLASGHRGERDDVLRALLCELTRAEDATVVNNNAAAVLLVLNTLAKGREAIVSRGELIEIGGAFRLPEIMNRAGTKLREIGTTNRTHMRDYVEALGPRTGLILKVHTSNYRIQGLLPEAGLQMLLQVFGDLFAVEAAIFDKNFVRPLYRYNHSRNIDSRDVALERDRIATDGIARPTVQSQCCAENRSRGGSRSGRGQSHSSNVSVRPAY